jgi:hypothetical protein
MARLADPVEAGKGNWPISGTSQYEIKLTHASIDLLLKSTRPNPVTIDAKLSYAPSTKARVGP